MDGDRGLARISELDQWARCGYQATSLTASGVELAWEARAASAAPATSEWSGLAFDRWCHAYLSQSARGRVDVVATSRAGALAPCTQTAGPLAGPTALAIDDAQRLYVLQQGRADVMVFDLWGRRVLCRTTLRWPDGDRPQPVDLAGLPCGALVLLAEPVGLVELSGRRRRIGPALRPPRGTRGHRPLRVAVGAEVIAVLWVPETGDCGVVATSHGAVISRVRGARALAFDGEDRIVVARGPGQAFLRWRRQRGGWVEDPPAAAPGFDGGALSRTPDGRLGYTTAAGVSFVSGDDVVYARQGSVISYRLDAGAYRARWGRLFLEACAPRGTDLRVQCLTSDEDDVVDALARVPPVRGERPVKSPEASPPLPSAAALQDLGADAQSLYRTSSRSDDGPAVDTLAVYEAPVMAPPGRYLWVVLGLSGTGRATPRVATLSVERPGHRLLDALPRRWSRGAIEADFLQRFLAPAEGVLHGLDQLASRRHSLVDPSAAPERTLDWLASLVGFVLDRRWPTPVQREFIAAAYDLFRIRGTQACLERALKIYLRRNVPVIERWRLAGLGGVVLASDRGGQTSDLPPRIASAQSGSAALGSFTIDADAGGTGAAHRFSVLVPMALDDEQREAVRAIVERFKPAHTAYDICELGDGMHVGSGLLVDLTSVVGPGSDWIPLVVGDTPIGIDALLGLPYPGARVGETTLIGAGCGEGVQVG